MKATLAALVVGVLPGASCSSDGDDQARQLEIQEAEQRAAGEALDEERAREAEEVAARLEQELEDLREETEAQGGDTGGGGTTGAGGGGGNAAVYYWP
jgi:ABC-type Fe3+-hydroxamate transport system substrate-binding protein